MLGSRFIFIKVLSDDFADVDVREDLCYHSRPKKQNSKCYFNRIMIPKKSFAKNNTNPELSSGFVLFTYGAERGIRTPGGFHLNGFQDRRDRPLRHLCMDIILAKRRAFVNKKRAGTTALFYYGSICPAARYRRYHSSRVRRTDAPRLSARRRPTFIVPETVCMSAGWRHSHATIIAVSSTPYFSHNCATVLLNSGNFSFFR